MNRRLVLSAHADDESIGAGGTIAKYAAMGAEVGVGVLTRDSDDDKYEIRQAEARKSWQQLGINDGEWAGLREHPLVVSELAVDIVAGWYLTFKPDVIMVPHAEETDPDHAKVAEIAKNAIIQTGINAFLVGYEVWTPINNPHLYEDISNVATRKARAINEYASQLQARDYSTAAMSLNRYRGAITGRGEYVEAFSLVTL